jgi:LysR family hydrogen peroxide-inducible transcriptional activator
MNLRDLSYLVAIAETRHFGKAAERCFVSQPTLSGQIRKLEEQLGVTIFERTNRSVELTPIGATILQHARNILEQTKIIEEVARAHHDPMAGSLRLGAIPTLSPYLIPLVLVPLRKQYPQMQLVLSEEITATLLERLDNHDIDAALVATPVDEPTLEVIDLFDEPFWLAHPRNHTLYTQDEISRDDLNELELLLLSDGHCLAQQVMDICRLTERPRPQGMGDLRAASLETLLQLVGAGFGCTLVPALATRGYWMTDSGIIARKLDFSDAFRRIALVFRRSFPRRSVLEAFADTAMKHLPNTVQPIRRIKASHKK